MNTLLGVREPRARWWRLLGVGLVVGAVLLVLAAKYLSEDSLRCEDAIVDGGSNYGEAEWSWVPLGTACRWTEERHGIDRVEEPGWGPTIIVGGMFVTGLGLLGRRSGGDPGRTETSGAAES